MASKVVMPSNSDHHHHHHQNPTSSDPSSRTFCGGSMNMDDILNTIYSDGSAAAGADADAGPTAKTVDEVWRDIVAGGDGGGGSSREPEMTLEDFLTKAGAVTEEDVRVPAPSSTVDQVAGGGGFVVDNMNCQFQVAMQNGPHMGYGNGGVVPAIGGSGSGRGKRRSTVEELPLDKATQQKQRRMIKNRESAARSRERKQAYTVELESLVTQLEEENARLLKEEKEKNKERLKQIMENLIPVVEKRRPPRVLRRVQSMSW